MAVAVVLVAFSRMFTHYVRDFIGRIRSFGRTASHNTASGGGVSQAPGGGLGPVLRVMIEILR